MSLSYGNFNLMLKLIFDFIDLALLHSAVGS